MNKEQKYVTVDVAKYIVNKSLTTIKNLVKKVREYEKDGNGTGQPLKTVQGLTVIDGQYDPIIKDEPNNKGRIRTVINVEFLHFYFGTDGIDNRERNNLALKVNVGQWTSQPTVNDRQLLGHVDRQPMVNVEFEELPTKNNDSEILEVKLSYEQKRVKELEQEVNEYKEQLKEVLKTQAEQQQRLFEITENNQLLLQNQQTLQIQPKQLEETTKTRKWWQRKRD